MTNGWEGVFQFKKDFTDEENTKAMNSYVRLSMAVLLFDKKLKELTENMTEDEKLPYYSTKVLQDKYVKTFIEMISLLTSLVIGTVEELTVKMSQLCRLQILLNNDLSFLTKSNTDNLCLYVTFINLRKDETKNTPHGPFFEYASSLLNKMKNNN